MYTFISNLINLVNTRYAAIGFLVHMPSGAWLWTATCYTLLNVVKSLPQIPFMFFLGSTSDVQREENG